jgi:hypothetical protein
VNTNAVHHPHELIRYQSHCYPVFHGCSTVAVTGAVIPFTHLLFTVATVVTPPPFFVQLCPTSSVPPPPLPTHSPFIVPVHRLLFIVHCRCRRSSSMKLSTVAVTITACRSHHCPLSSSPSTFTVVVSAHCLRLLLPSPFTVTVIFTFAVYCCHDVPVIITTITYRYCCRCRCRRHRLPSPSTCCCSSNV